MEKKETILTDIRGSLAKLTLNRPLVHHAFNLKLIRELSEAVRIIDKMDHIRIILIRSGGKHFSAGADLNWMREGVGQDFDQLKAESMELAQLFREIQESRKVVVSAVQGRVMGGAIGLIAAADIVIADSSAEFSFSEIKLGLVPATISPYVLRKTGYSRTSELMLTGRTFGASEARDSNLVHHICEEGDLEDTTEGLLNQILANGPAAMMGIKQLMRFLESDRSTDEILEYTAELIARLRISPEGQEGMNAFLSKRKPGWHETR